jgi:hypothetical protein
VGGERVRIGLERLDLCRVDVGVIYGGVREH